MLINLDGFVGWEVDGILINSIWKQTKQVDLELLKFKGKDSMTKE